MPQRLVPPLSKSDAQRALVLADILGVSQASLLPAGEALPRDVEVLRAGLSALRSPTSRIDCHDGGAPFRFLVGQAAVLPERAVDFVGTPRLGARPHEPLLRALREALGVTVTSGQPWPVRVETRALRRGVAFRVPGAESSQYASSLLLAAARLSSLSGEAVAVEVEGALTSEGYFALTESWLHRCGFSLAPVRAPVAAPPFPRIPGDWSSLGYLLALSWVCGLPVARLERNTGHPDERLAAHLASAGLSVSDRLTGVPKRGVDVDAEACPDAVPTLAVLATRLPAPSVFRRVGVLRHKESDRVEGVRALLAAAGLTSRLDGETLTVFPGAARDFGFAPRDDHRLAMSAAVLARLHRVRGEVSSPECVAKSFPGFWAEVAKCDAASR